ncbi:MAG: hypothetical protein AB7F19_03780 [Candidatus Babeliales bacterium]
MKKLFGLLLCVMCLAHAQEETVTVNVHTDDTEICQVKLEPGQSVEIERLLGYESAVKVYNDGLLSRIGSSVLKTVADCPFFSALALWALIFKRDSIANAPYTSMFIGGYLISDFALHMLHSAGQRVTVTE